MKRDPRRGRERTSAIRGSNAGAALEATQSYQCIMFHYRSWSRCIVKLIIKNYNFLLIEYDLYKYQ